MLAFRRLEASGLKVVQACQFRGSKSRNKVSVGEPAEGSNFVFLEYAFIAILNAKNPLSN
jgi:hypothetical protein